MGELLVMVPTRGRRAQCERFMKTFQETSDLEKTTLVFVTDSDDDAYQDMDWGIASAMLVEPREFLVKKLNIAAMKFLDDYRVLMFAGDDHVFDTPGWDRLMLAELDEMGGTGMVYPDDKRRNDIPEIVMISSDIVRELGWFAGPSQEHYFIDNIWGELGKRVGFIRFCGEAVIRHLHYTVDSTVVRDEIYLSAEEKFGNSDREAFFAWQRDVMPFQVAQLRRKFSKDIEWLFSKV